MSVNPVNLIITTFLGTSKSYGLPIDKFSNVPIDIFNPTDNNGNVLVNIANITHKRLDSVTSYSASANTNIFSSNLTSDISGYFYITIVTNTASVVNLIFNGITIALNQGNSLNANAGYTFTLPMIAGDTLNVQFATAGTVSVWVDEGVV